MTTRMVHPKHGATHAYRTAEVEKLKGFGWEVESEVAQAVAEDKLQAEIEDDIASLIVDAPKKKLGRPSKAK